MTRRFIICGAFKCGTSSLAAYLREHPRIVMAEPKEPYFFATDFPRIRAARSLSEYANLFRSEAPRDGWLGEATAGYLYSRVAVENIRRFAPEARLIVLLRNPVELVPSFHAELLYARDERLEFPAAWEHEPLRRRGLAIPRSCRTPAFLRYRDVGRLGEQVARLLAHFPRRQVRFYSLGDLKRDAASVYRDVLEFLELPDDRRTEFSAHNVHKRHRLTLVGDWTQRPPRVVRAAALGAKRVLGIRRWGVLDRVRRLNCPERSRKPLPEALRLAVREEFRADTALLETLIERDLASWKEAA